MTFKADDLMNDERSFLWKCGQLIGRVLSTLLFELKVDGLHFIPDHGGALIVSNHQSFLDPVVLAVRLQRPVSYLAKSELFKYSAGNWLIRALNGIPIQLGAGDIGALKQTIHRLQQGHLLNLYPEGSRTHNGEMLPIQKGVALVVRRAKVPVIPAVIVGAFDAWPAHRTMFRPGSVRVRFGPPMDLCSLPPDEIIATIDRTLRGMFDELRNHHTASGRPIMTSQRK